MTRTIALVALSFLLAGCTKQHSRGQGLFDRPTKAPPPPYGSPGAPSANQSPLGIPSADPTAPLPPGDHALVPPRSDDLLPAGGAADANAGFPPFRRRSQPETLPSPFAPKEPVKPATPPPAAPGSPLPVAPSAVPPGAPAANAKNLDELKALVATASSAWNAVDTYETTLTRRELNPKGQINSEVLIFQFRREPMSVFTRNIGESGKGRETVYNPSKFDDKLYVMLGAGDSKLVRAGFIAPPMSPDDSRVKEKARYSIRSAGFGRPIAVLADAVANLAGGKAPANSVVFDGEVKRSEYPYPLVGVTHNLRPGDDPVMPTGGVRHYFFDMKKDSPSRGLPVLMTANDASGKEVEYYLFEKIKLPAGLTDADFDPARLGKKR